MEKNLYNKESSIAFYEDRYANGYMDDWPVEKKQRIFNLIRSLPLPEHGTAVEFGCGNGVFTEVIRQALPKWEVYGTDISTLAIQTAKKRYPLCHFFVNADKGYSHQRFDFLLTHHVLEHVYDLEMVTNEMTDMMKETQGKMLHILPCGNPASFEYKLCQMRIDGINTAMKNRFFFEDEGHVRRLNTDQLSEALAKYNFTLQQGWYSNQYYGAIKWITDYDQSFINNLTDYKKANSIVHKLQLLWLRGKLLLIKKAKLKASKKPKLSSATSILNRFRHRILRIQYKVARYITTYYDNQANREWETRCMQPNGSEMYLFFTRTSS